VYVVHNRLTKHKDVDQWQIANIGESKNKEKERKKKKKQKRQKSLPWMEKRVRFQRQYSTKTAEKVHRMAGRVVDSTCT
jgi:hypothetical protein